MHRLLRAHRQAGPPHRRLRHDRRGHDPDPHRAGREALTAPGQPFERTLLVHFHEIDRAGIVYFARIFEYCHRVYEELLEELLGPLEQFFRTTDWGLPLVHAEADYAQPLRLGDRVRVQVTVERLGAKSVTLAYTLTDAKTGDLRARAKLVHAFVSIGATSSDRSDFAPRAAHPDYVAGLRRLGLIA